MTAAASPQTPAMQQYHRMKAEHPGALLFFRMGDFYELFFEDAVTAAKALDIALTSRSKDKDGTPIPMCGVPHHAAPTYVGRLVRQGFRVALCEQMEDPRSAKGVVRREVVRVVTPGTQLEAAALDAGDSSFVMALSPAESAVGVAYLDATTGAFVAAEWPGPNRWDRLRDDMGSMRPREVLVPRGAALPPWLVDPTQTEAAIPRTEIEERTFDPRTARRELLGHFGVVTLEAFGCESLPHAVAAAGAALRYVRETQKRDLTHVLGLRTRDEGDALVVDALTRRNLELVESLADGGRRGTLLDVLDETRTPMGSRLLRDWILRPLVRVEEIQDRLDAVEELAYRTLERGRFRDAAGGVQDLERILGRVTLGIAGPRDLVALARSLRALPDAESALAECIAPLTRRSVKDLDPPTDVAADVEAILVEDPPASVKEGGLVRDGVDPELDELREVSRGGRTTIAAIEERERQRTGIASLKVRFNRVFGYYIEISKANLGLVPSDYVRRQTIVGGERFVTPELKEYEEKVLRADEGILTREAEIFEALRARVAAEARRVQETARAAAALDVLASLAEVACRYNYVKPRISRGDELAYAEGRHPMMERLLPDPFVANDLGMGEGAARLYILTGPNMGGKSTFLRQTGLIVLMAQMGSFVPAREAKVGVADRLFTRVGASDQILRGQSTFMVEMQETAHIVRHATSRSLVLLDEIGRGTATFDGLSIAWAVAEHLAADPRPGPKCLFATHYHELTDLAADISGVGNLHVSAREWKDAVVFLRKIEPGGSDRSFGIQVARLAGLPAPVVVRAQEILGNLERTEFDREGRPRIAHSDAGSPSGARQLALFSGRDEAVLEDLRRIEVDGLTPLQALTLLAELKRRLSS
ncbi:MAG: DNA mismatch repair protein MutS [Acidobacteria bacterium]|nr:DNA mismatch repair protein MutS [Acidobacteriota bacterium]